jgi:hypothetical protein
LVWVELMALTPTSVFSWWTHTPAFIFSLCPSFCHSSSQISINRHCNLSSESISAIQQSSPSSDISCHVIVTRHRVSIDN